MDSDEPSGSDVVPRPDPTRLTTEAVNRAMSSFREVMEIRLTAMDKATDLVAKDAARIAAAQERNRELLREDVGRQLESLRELVDERFKRIDERIVDRDERTKLAAAESRISLGAALDAAKEAVQQQNKFISQVMDKMEAQFGKQVDSIITLMDERNRSFDQRLADLKERQDLGQGGAEGAREHRSDQRLSTGQVLVVALVLIGVVGIVVSIVSILASR